MSNVDVVFRVVDHSSEQQLASLEKQLQPSNLEAFLGTKARQHVHTAAAARFRSQGDSRVGKWAKLSEYTKKDRQRRGFSPSRPINKRTGDLEAFITSTPGVVFSDGDGASLVMPGGASAKTAKKFRVAQEGLDPNPIPGFSPVPARPVLGLGEPDSRDLTRDLALFIDRGLFRA